MYRVRIGFHPVGTTTVVSRRTPEGRTYKSRTEILLSRGSQEIRMLEEEIWEEDAQGRVTALVLRREGMGPDRWEDRLTRTPGGWVRSRERNGTAMVDTILQASKSALGPTGIEDRLSAPPSAGVIRQIDIDALEPVTCTFEQVATDTLLHAGGSVVCRVFAIADSPGVAGRQPLREWRDERGRLWRQEEPTTEFLLERTEIRGPVEPQGSATIFDALQWKPTPVTGSPPLEGPCRLRLVPLDPAAADAGEGERPPISSSDVEQKLERDPATGAWVLVIDRPRPQTTTETDRAGWASAEDLASYLAPTIWIDWRDPSIREFADRIAAGADSPTDEALRLERSVHETIRRADLETVLAPASQTLRDRSGDCTEHAVLLAACCRARGIPSRLAVGAVPVEGQLVYHLWTEVYLNRWTGLDATLARGASAPCAVGLGTWRDLAENPKDLLDVLRGFAGRYRLEVVEETE